MSKEETGEKNFGFRFPVHKSSTPDPARCGSAVRQIVRLKRITKPGIRWPRVALRGGRPALHVASMVADMSENDIDLNRVITDSAYRRRVIERLKETRADEEQLAQAPKPFPEDQK